MTTLSFPTNWDKATAKNVRSHGVYVQALFWFSSFGIVSLVPFGLAISTTGLVNTTGIITYFAITLIVAGVIATLITLVAKPILKRKRAYVSFSNKLIAFAKTRYGITLELEEALTLAGYKESFLELDLNEGRQRIYLDSSKGKNIRFYSYNTGKEIATQFAPSNKARNLQRLHISKEAPREKSKNTGGGQTLITIGFILASIYFPLLNEIKILQNNTEHSLSAVRSMWAETGLTSADITFTVVYILASIAITVFAVGVFLVGNKRRNQQYALGLNEFKHFVRINYKLSLEEEALKELYAGGIIESKSGKPSSEIRLSTLLDGQDAKIVYAKTNLEYV